MLFEPIKPMLLTMGKEAFNSEDWLYDVKWDGWRILVHKSGSRVEAYTRTGNCVTSQFPELQELTKYIHTDTAILDCEGVCLRDGRPVFDDFQYRGRLTQQSRIARAAETHPATFVAFDVLQTGNESHLAKTLVERKAILSSVVEPSSVISPTIFTDGEGIKLKQLTETKGWEGIVAKRKTSTYRTNYRTPHWQKLKNWQAIDTVILGYRTEPMFALIVGLHFPTVKNKVVATVEFGFSPEEKYHFRNLARTLHTHSSKGVQWIEAELCCRIQFLDRTDNHKLRICSFNGFLPGKDPNECYWSA